ncbi:hypothetical protein TWF970_000646 [Orbilia oligospora]|uniref:Peptidase A1 domain-containing protein n=1 Tax=Orbilia oligospora TaxID=2813651 RepID=A0A7C8VRJ4_ORBOL|nr:hypothetical protein TWF970_000646 [Orbilia oligospora]
MAPIFDKNDVMGSGWKAQFLKLAVCVQLLVGIVTAGLDLQMQQNPGLETAVVVLQNITLQPYGTSYYGLANVTLDDGSKSSTYRTFNPPPELASLRGNGKFGYDRFSLEDLELPSVPFIAAPFEDDFPQLGFGITSNDTTPWFLQSIWNQSLIKVKGFGVYLGAYEKNSSQIVLGGIDTANYNAPMMVYEHDSATNVQTLAPIKVDTVDTSTYENGPSLRSPPTALLLGESDIRVPEYLYDWLIQRMGVTYQLREKKLEQDYMHVGSSYGESATGEACRIFLGLSKDYERINANAPKADIYLGDPFFRAAYVWFDCRNNQTGFAIPKQDVRASGITGIRADGIVATVGWNGAAILAPNTSYLSGWNPSKSGPRVNIQVLAGSIVAGLIFIGAVASWAFWLVLRKQNAPEMPPAPTAGLELEGQAKFEMPAKHGNCEVVGSGGYPNELPEEDQQEYRRELLASHAFPAELPGSTILRSGRNSRDSPSSRDSNV